MSKQVMLGSQSKLSKAERWYQLNVPLSRERHLSDTIYSCGQFLLALQSQEMHQIVAFMQIVAFCWVCMVRLNSSPVFL